MIEYHNLSTDLKKDQTTVCHGDKIHQTDNPDQGQPGISVTATNKN